MALFFFFFLGSHVTIVTSPLSKIAMEELCPHVMPTAIFPSRRPVTFLGHGWLVVEPEPSWP